MMRRFTWTTLVWVALAGWAFGQEARIQELREAAERGEVSAQYALANSYLGGRGVPKNDAEAARWFRQAAEQGDPAAQRMLGLMYVEGMGLPEDATQAVRWFRQAAEQGDALAEVMLGSMYSAGMGVEEDADEEDDAMAQSPPGAPALQPEDQITAEEDAQLTEGAPSVADRPR